MLHPQWTITRTHTCRMFGHSEARSTNNMLMTHGYMSLTTWNAISCHTRSSPMSRSTRYMTIHNASHVRLHVRKEASHNIYTHVGTSPAMCAHSRNNLAVPTHNIHAAVPRSCSYNYIFKVLFTAPSWYLFAIGFGHMSIFWWDIAPVRIPVQKNITRTLHAVY